MTQEALAHRAGVGVRTIRGLETGERADPRMTTVRLLADALGLNAEDREELLAAAVRTTNEAPGPPPPPATPADPEPADEPEPVGRAGYGRPGSPSQDALAGVADQLAQSVAVRWRREEEQRQIQDPYPLPVRWGLAPDELIDHWANIRRVPTGGTPLDLAGRLDEVVPLYRRIASGRLVILGRSGSGKTILTLRFVLDYLASRSRTEAVPVIFSIGSWNPTTITLRDWLARRLTRDHPGLAADGPGGVSMAAALVETGWILPVLDGFDEIADGLRRPALEALNATTLPLVLTSRPAEYAAAVAETDVLTSAAAVEMTDLTPADLTEYLPRTARKAGGGATPWDPVLAVLREQPDGPAGKNLTTVLATPLMVALARTIYSDTPDHDPAELLDTDRFGGPEALEDHLLTNFIPTVYGREPEHRRAFDPDRAQHWLGYLAHHLTRLGTPDLAWWQLGRGLRRTSRTVVTAVATGLAVGVVDVLAGSFLNPTVGILFDGVIVGTLAGLMFGLGYWVAVAARNGVVAPSGVRLRLRRPRGTARPKVAARSMLGLLCGLIFGFAYGIVIGTLNGYGWHAGLAVTLNIALTDGFIYGVVFAVGTGLTAGLLSLLETPLDVRSAVNPQGLLATNRRTVAAQMALSAVVFGLLTGFGSVLVIALLRATVGGLLMWTARNALQLGVLSGLGGALGYMLILTAWGQWAVFSRIWLPLTGRLPWSTVAFLEDAYRRGVLRQSGAVYQFRHARLQHHLTRTHVRDRRRH